jgi:hypothetical protein
MKKVKKDFKAQRLYSKLNGASNDTERKNIRKKIQKHFSSL